MKNIFQVISITRLGKNGTVPAKKEVRKHLGPGESVWCGISNGEVIFRTKNTSDSAQVESSARHLTVPEKVAKYLELQKDDMVALIQRGDGVSLKRFSIDLKAGFWAGVEDQESDTRLVRTVTANPQPLATISELAGSCRKLSLRHDPLSYLRNSNSTSALIWRRVLGLRREDDAVLKERVYEEAAAAQDANGSWNSDVVLTSRTLRELAEMGFTKEKREIVLAAEWLLARKESEYNPGMFFLNDKLAGRQIEIIEGRMKGIRERFRERRTGEIKTVRKGIDTAHNPCGLRMMWPNALALRALIELGYEEDKRVRKALGFLLHGRWCDSSYQYGMSSVWISDCAPTREAIDSVAHGMKSEYAYGGVGKLDDFSSMDLTKKTGEKLFRISESKSGAVTTYTLGMPVHLQACELITAWALYKTRNPGMRTLLDAHLWRFAARQRQGDGHFDHKYVGKYFYLDLFASFDAPVAKSAILRSIPWIIASQNEDGSWGEDGEKDSATLAVVRALRSIKDFLPERMRIN